MTTELSPAATPHGRNSVPGAPGTVPGSGDTRSPTACSQQGVPGFGLASVPPTLKEMSTAHSLPCNKPQQNHHLPGVLSPRLCGRARSDPPRTAGLLAEESEAAGDAREQQPGGALPGEEPRSHGDRDTLRSRQRARGPGGSGQRGKRRSGCRTPLMWRRQRHPQPAAAIREPRAAGPKRGLGSSLPLPGSPGAATPTAPAAAAAATSWGTWWRQITGMTSWGVRGGAVS